MIDAGGNCQRSYEAKISSEKARQARIDRENAELKKKGQARKAKKREEFYQKLIKMGLSSEEARKKARSVYP